MEMGVAFENNHILVSHSWLNKLYHFNSIFLWVLCIYSLMGHVGYYVETNLLNTREEEDWF